MAEAGQLPLWPPSGCFQADPRVEEPCLVATCSANTRGHGVTRPSSFLVQQQGPPHAVALGRFWCLSQQAWRVVLEVGVCGGVTAQWGAGAVSPGPSWRKPCPQPHSSRKALKLEEGGVAGTSAPITLGWVLATLGARLGPG